MSWPAVLKVLCLVVSAVVASLVKQGQIPAEFVELASWLSGALAAAPLHIDRLFGYVSVPKAKIEGPYDHA